MLPLLDEAAMAALSVANLVIEAFSSSQGNEEVLLHSQHVATTSSFHGDVTAIAAHVLQQKKRNEHLGIWY